MHALLCGWFSFEPMGATAGDVQAREVARAWLREANVSHDVACAPVFGEGVDWRAVDPARYTHLVFVCGPFDAEREPVRSLLSRFAEARLVGLDVSVERSLGEHNPFDLLFERDSSRGGAPDLAFAAPSARLPAVGVVLVPHQREYGSRAQHSAAERLIDRVLRDPLLARVDLDTALNNDPATRDPGSLRSPGAFESLVARTDAVLTTRLHGLVLALKTGVPAVALDPVAGGAKVLRQSRLLDWPYARAVDETDEAWLRGAVDACLQPDARAEAWACARRAAMALESVREDFVGALRDDQASRRP